MQKVSNNGQIEEEIILGIDPGTSILGYGIIKKRGQKLELLSLGIVNLSKFTSHQQKLKRIYERVSYLIKEYKPTCCAIEAPFYGKNPQSMLKLGRAQGVAITAAMVHEIEVTEYSPKKIKVAVTGNGNASKEQVAGMLGRMFAINDFPKYMDATDGLAAAVCHHFQNGRTTTKSQYKGWKEFIANNPEKLASPKSSPKERTLKPSLWQKGWDEAIP